MKKIISEKSNRIYFLSGICVIVLIALTDTTSLTYPYTGKLGTYLWFVSYLFVIIFAFRCFAEIIKFTISKKTPFTLLTILTFIFLIVTQLNNPASLSGETSIEINCAISHLSNAKDLGFRQTCLFGYPARQFFLPAIPSLMLGRNLINLNMGGSLYFLMGMTVFAYSIIRTYGNNYRSDLLSTLALSSLLHFHYFNHFLFFFEQSIFPLSIGLMLIGSFLIYIKSGNRIALVPLGLSLLYLPASYTPALALLFFAWLVIFYFLYTNKKNKNKRSLFLIMILSAVVLISTLTYRYDINLTGSDRTVNQELTDAISAFLHLILHDQGNSYTSPVFTFIFVSILVLGLIGATKLLGRISSLWIIAVIILSVISQGYAFYSIEFRLHRSLVIVPVFLILFVQTISKLDVKKWNTTLYTIMVLIFITGLMYNVNFLTNRQPNPHYRYIQWLEINRVVENVDQIFITQQAGQQNNLISLHDNLSYFMPGINSTYSEFSFDENCQLAQQIEDSILITEDHECRAILLSDETRVIIGSFISDQDVRLDLVKL